jgi:hypothetical protein
MSNGRQAGGQRWIGFSDCDAHIQTEDSVCPICRITALEADNKTWAFRYQREITALTEQVVELNAVLDELWKLGTYGEIKSRIREFSKPPTTEGGEG